MMRATWPELARWQDVSYPLTGLSLDPQQSINGAETVVPTMRGKWTMTAQVVVAGEAAQLEWQTFVAQMEGRIGTVLVPMRSRFRPMDRNGKFTPFRHTAQFARSQTFEHWGFEATPISRATVASDAALRSTRLSITITDTTGVRPGQIISIGERAHRVQAAWSEAEGTQNLMIQPPLREAVAAGADVELSRPVCRMRFASEGEGVIDENMARAQSVSVNFVEAV
ncbi:hypothetical protein [Thioclava sp. GXIMD2076]|uniref:hypothetical protein n=1 Tax=Thioclava sp. GXIMD2076 TaxID=3131931 RepID=UPI0030D24D85